MKIVLRITTEVIGSPKEYVEETLQKLLVQLPKEEGVIVHKQDVAETTLQENEKYWGTFATIEFEVPDFKRMLEVCYDFLPSTVEILEPAGMKIDCHDVENFMNDFLSKIHKYAMVLKKLQAENIFMMKELEKVTGKKFAKPKV